MFICNGLIKWWPIYWSLECTSTPIFINWPYDWPTCPSAKKQQIRAIQADCTMSRLHVSNAPPALQPWINNGRHLDTISFPNSNDVIMTAIVSQITGVTFYLSNRLLRRRSKKTSKLRVTHLCEGNPPVTHGFPSQRASNTEHACSNFFVKSKSTVDLRYCGCNAVIAISCFTEQCYSERHSTIWGAFEQGVHCIISTHDLCMIWMIWQSDTLTS